MTEQLKRSRRRRRRRRPPGASPAPIELLTPDQAASKLGWTGKRRGDRLKRIVWSVEERQRVKVFLLTGTDTRPAYFVTMGALRKYLPQLFAESGPDQVARHIRSYLDIIEGKIEEMLAAKVAETVRPLTEDSATKFRVVKSVLEQLEKRISIIEPKRR